MQEQEEDRVAAKSKPTTMNLTSTVSTSSSSVNHPIASKSLVILKASTGKPDARARRNSEPDAAPSSQGSLKDAYLGGLMVGVAGKPVATDKKSGIIEVSLESASWGDHEKKVSGKPDAESAEKREADAQRTQACHSERESSMSSCSRDLEATGKLVTSRSSGNSEKLKLEAENGHIIFICLQQLYPTWRRSLRSYANLRRKSNG